ncbi:MAG: hypothetical protein FJW99_04550 [Actinobacteria bacterium]|nr:hypothetical protein [Actinomycetota bacterium]MBM3696935.1 hypothetical protein [Actinomycetota bacterium]
MIFPLKSSRWSRLWTSSGGPYEADVTDESVNVRIGWVGHAEVPIARVVRVLRLRWPWWAGLGVRITRGMVVFAPSAGEGVVLETDEPITVRCPMEWSTSRVLVMVRDPAAFAGAVAARRAASEG